MREGGGIACGSETTFTWRGAVRGARGVLPLVVSSAVLGLLFGVTARDMGLAGPEAVLMSALVAAGASQFAALEIGGETLPLLAVVLATLAVNARHLLMGATLREPFAKLTRRQIYGSLVFLSDGNWAFSLREFAAGRRDAAVLAGGGAAMFSAWTVGTALGHGASLGPEALWRWGADFIASAFFVAVLVSFRPSRAELLPWAVAGATAWAGAVLLEGHWYPLIGALAGAAVAAWRAGDAA